jgi:hypothetical protein
VILVIAARIGSERPRRRALVAASMAILAGVASWGALRGSLPDVPTWQVLCSRALGELARSPAPYLTTSVVYFVEVFSQLVAFAALLQPVRPRWLGPIACLLLITRAAADIPGLALLLVVAAFSARLLCATQERDSHLRTIPAGGSLDSAAP